MALVRWGEKLGRADDVIAPCDLRAGFEPLRARGIVARRPSPVARRPIAVSPFRS
jgi:hypothetical protein